MGLRASLCVVLGGMLACGDNIPSIPLAEREHAELNARCERLTRCGLFADAAVCNAFFRDYPDPNFDAALEAGTIRYDGVAAKQCYEALASLTCDGTSVEARTLPPPCTKVFTGIANAGEPCVYDAACRSGRCDKPTCESSECCPGTCADHAPASVGSPCDRDRDCEAHAFCGADKRCHALLDAGQDCARDLECGYGLVCVGGGVTGTCRPAASAGETCPFLRCADIGMQCAGGACVPVGLPGVACSTNTDCSIYAECDPVRRVCVDVPSLGMSCTTSCAGDAWCQPGVPTNTCVAPLANGEFCAATNQCASLNCPEDIVQRCAETPVCF